MAPQVVQTLALDQVPVAQAAVHVVMVPTTAGGPAAAAIPTVFFDVAVAHTFVVPTIRESVAEVQVYVAEACTPTITVQAVHADLAAFTNFPAAHVATF